MRPWIQSRRNPAGEMTTLARAAALILMLLSALVTLSACGPTEAEQNATSTAVATEEMATQAAEAPTATPMPTDTPAPTGTPAAELSPTPDYAIIALTEDDLPAEFVARPATEMTFGPGRESPYPVPAEIVTGYEFELPGEAFVVGFSVRILDEAEGPRFDATLDYMNQLFLASSPAEGPTPLEDLAELEGIGETVSGQTTTITDAAGVEYQIDVLTFRRSTIATFLVAGYPADSPPEIAVNELARLVDQRIRDGLDSTIGR